tara:strand:+ start:1570 stop:1998 length:429 start_codon:yes stop_codon:yes gene_type:complete
MITITNDMISSVELGTIFEEVSVYSSVESSSGESNEMSESFSLEIEPDQDIVEKIEIEEDHLYEALHDSYSEERLITLLKSWLAATDPEYLMEVQKKADEIDYMLLYMNLMSDINSLVHKQQTTHLELKGETLPYHKSGGKL